MTVVLDDCDAFTAVFNREQRIVSTSRRWDFWTKWRVYSDGVVSNDDGGVYIWRERSTSRRRRTSVLFVSYTWVGPRSAVDPTPFSLEK